MAALCPRADFRRNYYWAAGSKNQTADVRSVKFPAAVGPAVANFKLGPSLPQSRRPQRDLLQLLRLAYSASGVAVYAYHQRALVHKLPACIVRTIICPHDLGAI